MAVPIQITYELLKEKFGYTINSEAQFLARLTARIATFEEEGIRKAVGTVEYNDYLANFDEDKWKEFFFGKDVPFGSGLYHFKGFIEPLSYYVLWRLVSMPDYSNNILGNAVTENFERKSENEKLVYLSHYFVRFKEGLTTLVMLAQIDQTYKQIQPQW